MQIKDHLQNLGLTPGEIKVYTSLMRKGDATALEISRLSGLSRPSTYEIIASLQEKTLLSEKIKGKKRYFCLEDPSRLVELADRRTNECISHKKYLENDLDEIRMTVTGQKPVVRMYEGISGIKQLVDELTDENNDKNALVEPYFEFTDMDALYRLVSPRQLEPLRKSIGTKSGESFSLQQRRSIPVVGKDNRRVILPNSIESTNAHISVKGDCITMHSLDEKVHTVQISSPPLSSALREIFRLAIKGSEFAPKSAKTD